MSNPITWYGVWHTGFIITLVWTGYYAGKSPGFAQREFMYRAAYILASLFMSLGWPVVLPWLFVRSLIKVLREKRSK